MKQLIGILLLITSIQASASSLSFGFSNPSFSGNGFSTHALSRSGFSFHRIYGGTQEHRAFSVKIGEELR